MGHTSLIAWFMGPTRGPSRAGRTQVGPMLATWNLLSGMSYLIGPKWNIWYVMWCTLHSHEYIHGSWFIMLCYGLILGHISIRIASQLRVTKKSADYSDVGDAVLQNIGKYIICFPLRRGSAIPTCITARAWRTCCDACRDRYLAVSFEVADGENVPGIPGACTTRNFTYLARGPCKW